MAIVSNKGYRDPHIPTKPLAKKVHHNPSLAVVRGLPGRQYFVGKQYWAPTSVLPVNNIAPTLVDTTPTVGQVFDASSYTNGSWTGTPTPTFSGVLKINGVVKTMPYTILAADAGNTIIVEVTATNTAGSVMAATTASTAIDQLPSNTVAPVLTLVSGEPVVGNVIAAADISTGSWNGTPAPSFSKALKLNGVTKTLPYTILTADIGQTFVAEVTASNSAGNVTASSAASTGVVGANIFPDSGMSATTGWTPQNTTLAIASGQLQLTSTTAAGNNNASRFFNSGIAAGQQWRVKGLLRVGTAQQTYFVSFGVGSNGQSTPVTSTSLTANQLTFTVPSGETNFTIYVQQVNNAIGQTSFADDITLQRVA